MESFKIFLEAQNEKNGKDYKEYFMKMLKKYGVDEPDKLADKDKKKFYDDVDKNWKAKKETD